MHCFQTQRRQAFSCTKGNVHKPRRAVKGKKKLAYTHNTDTMAPATTHIFTMNSTVKLSFNGYEGMTMSFGGRLLGTHKTLIRTLLCQ